MVIDQMSGTLKALSKFLRMRTAQVVRFSASASALICSVLSRVSSIKKVLEENQESSGENLPAAVSRTYSLQALSARKTYSKIRE